MNRFASISLGALILAGMGTAAQAQSQPGATPPVQTAALQTPPAPATPAGKAPDAIDLYFESGSSNVRDQDKGLLDHASRLYSEGKPIVMVVAGSADPTGPADLNLRLSQTRADNVVHELVARGIPVERLQVLAKGVSDLPVPGEGAEPQDRRVEITWR